MEKSVSLTQLHNQLTRLESDEKNATAKLSEIVGAIKVITFWIDELNRQPIAVEQNGDQEGEKS